MIPPSAAGAKLPKKAERKNLSALYPFQPGSPYLIFRYFSGTFTFVAPM
jgi:hypothetical protein